MTDITRKMGAWVMSVLLAAAMMMAVLAYAPPTAEGKDRARCHGQRHASINDGHVRARCGHRHANIKDGHVRTHSKHHASIKNGHVRTHR